MLLGKGCDEKVVLLNQLESSVRLPTVQIDRITLEEDESGRACLDIVKWLILHLLRIIVDLAHVSQIKECAPSVVMIQTLEACSEEENASCGASEHPGRFWALPRMGECWLISQHR